MTDSVIRPGARRGKPIEAPKGDDQKYGRECEQCGGSRALDDTPCPNPMCASNPVTRGGRTMTVEAWIRDLGLNSDDVHRRVMNEGMPLDFVLFGTMPEEDIDDPRRPQMSRDFEWVTTYVYTIPDPFRLYLKLEGELTVGIKRGDRGTLLECLDKAEKNARDAHRLYLQAHLEWEKFDRTCEVLRASMRDQATTELQAEKDKGSRSKQITDADVLSRMASMFHEEWEYQEAKRQRGKGMVKDCEKLADLWMLRVRTLQTMISNLR
jgi:hypothetical protein